MSIFPSKCIRFHVSEDSNLTFDTFCSFVRDISKEFWISVLRQKRPMICFPEHNRRVAAAFVINLTKFYSSLFYTHTHTHTVVTS